MLIKEFENKYFEETANLLALFRVKLKSFKGINDEPNIIAAKEELDSFIKDKQYPIYVCLDNDAVIGYMILKVDGVVWVEQIYVREEYRRKGVGSLLFETAEKVSNDLGEETVFNYVHPNNNAMLRFLKSKGYTVLNLIEIRKPWKGEKTSTVYKVGDNEFDY